MKFPSNMFVPDGSSILYKVYDGPECSSVGDGAKDITGKSEYVDAGIYSAGLTHWTTHPVEQMGLYLQWEPGHVQESPLYSRRPISETQYNPSAMMDFCIGLGILNSQGLP
jgi:hypothetical protein